MGRVSKRSILSVVFLSIALLLGFLIWLKQPPNPTYKGRSLTEWLDDLEAGRFGTPQIEQRYDQAQQALYAIGEAAVPRLLHLIEQRDSKMQLAFIRLASKQNIIPITFRNEQQRQWLAGEGFSALREKGSTAVPRLIRMIDDPTRDGGSAAAALTYMGAGARPAIPSLIRALKRKKNWGASFLAIVANGDSTALQALIQALDDPDLIMRYTVVRAILTIHGAPKVVVPALIACLDDPAPDVRREAAGWMETFGTNALIAVPRMRQLTNDNDPATRALAERFFQVVKFPAVGILLEQ